jgi:NADPH2:quinone reductase
MEARMRVVEMSRFGEPEVLQLVERSTPTPGRGEVLIKVQAAGVNFAETLMRDNRYAMTPELPVVLGTEVVGTVERLGPDVAGPSVGARVAVPLFDNGGYSGGYADYVLARAELLVRLPATLPAADATALMIQGLTALHLTRQVAVRGKTVLITAAAGGVGSLLVQLAKREGARTIVAAASNDTKLDLARSLGADAAVNYTRPDWIARARELTGGGGPDVIYESVGGPITGGCLEALAPLGCLIIYGALNIQAFQLGVPELLGLIFKNQSVRGFAVMPLLTREQLLRDLAELFDMAARGALRVIVGGTFPLERAADAHRALAGRRSQGKLVLLPHG